MNSSPTHSNLLWETLVHHALVGNGQHPLSKALKKHLSELNIDTEDDKHALLEGIGIVQLLEKGAQEWITNESPLPAVPDFEEENPCSLASMQHLKAILDGHHSKAFPEFTQLLVQYKRSLPAMSLPKLLDQCVQNTELWQLIHPILGKRGLWLLQQHPSWKTLVPQEISNTEWFSLKEPQQSKVFLRFRSQSPVAARESLLKYWSKLDYKAKARLLPAFSQGLSLDDEDFLETCLDDKRKQVRDIASNLLTTLIDAQLVKRLFHEAQQCLILKDKSLHIKLPEDLPIHTKRDGITPSGSKYPGGMKLNWVHQLLARIPFSFWEQEWDLGATKIVRLFAQSGYPVLVQGITESLLRFPHQEGTDAQLKLWINSGNDVFWQNPAAKELLKKGSPTIFNTCVIQWLEQYGPFIPSDSLTAYWLSNYQQPWEAQLSKIVLFGFQDIIQNRRSPDWNLFHYHNIIDAAAYHTDPALLNDFKNRWYMQTAAFGRWATEIEKFLQTLNFRAEMKKELEHS